MANYNDNNKSFNNGLYGNRAGGSVTLAAALKNAFGDPPPLNDNNVNSNVTSTGRGGMFSLSAADNTISVLSSSAHHTFANDKVVGLLYNSLTDAATGAHVAVHHLEDPQTGGGNEGNAKHAAATIKFTGKFVHGGTHAKHRKIALITQRGNIITYTLNTHITSGKHTFVATGSGGPDFGGSIKSFDSQYSDPETRRLVQLGYR